MLILRPQDFTTGDPSIAQAAAILRSGGLVAFPTETVYGLGAIYDCEPAVARMFRLKGRPPDNPLIAHISHPDQLALVATHITALEERLMLAFWPGPLTIVLPKSAGVPDVVTAGLPTVGVRMPGSDIALSLIAAAGKPVVAPSANLSGRPSPTTARHVEQDLLAGLDLLLDGGETRLGLESTVVQVRDGVVFVLRPGTITRDMLAEATGVEVRAADHDGDISNEAPIAPGMKYQHYAPRAEVILFMERASAEIGAELRCQRDSTGVIAFADTLALLPADVPAFTLGARGQADIAARKLYAYLREVDDLGLGRVLVEGIEASGLGEAVMNRLHKAATSIRGLK